MLYQSLVLFFSQIFFIRGELINDPTLKPTKNFSACGDADALVPANNKQVASIMFHRTYDERKKIEECYNKKHASESALTFSGALDLNSKDYLNALYALVLQPPERILADTIFASITTGHGGLGDIEEVICANDKPMKDRIDKWYQDNNHKTVASHLATFRADDKPYQNVMQKYCWVGLCQNKKITPEEADKEAQTLRGISAKKHKTDFKNKLIELLDKYCEPDVKLIFQKYRQGDNGIEDAISDAFDVDRERRAFNILARYIEDPCKYYAFELRHAADSAKNICKQINKINRIILTRSERDLFCVAKAYPSQDKGYKTFTSRLSKKIAVDHIRTEMLSLIENPLQPLYVESIRYLLGKP